MYDMYDMEIQAKIEKLPEHVKRELSDFIEFLLNKYSMPQERQPDKMKNPLLDIAGFAEIGKMNSKDIDKEILDDPFFSDNETFDGPVPHDLSENHDKYLYGEK